MAAYQTVGGPVACLLRKTAHIKWKEHASSTTVSVWWGFLNVAEKDRIESVIKKAKRYGYPSSDVENVHTLAASMESKLFNNVWYNTNHVLHQLIPPEKDTHYNLQQRSHSLTLPSEDNNLIRKNFLHRMLFRHIY